MVTQSYFRGTGRRKSAIAQVKLVPGNGSIMVNDKRFEELFARPSSLLVAQQPFQVSNTGGKFNALVKVKGGGVVGQLGAIVHGIARALIQADAGLKPLLRKYGLVTRDPRVKERKKYGLKRARKAPQYTKR